jgi:hypothetical protein
MSALTRRASREAVAISQLARITRIFPDPQGEELS